MSGPIFVLAGLGYGDEGKGTLTDFLARRYPLRTVVRYNGGSQAAHHVVTPDGRAHCFAQFGSGTFVPGVATYLSRHMAVDPFALENEAAALRDRGVADAFERLVVDAECPIIHPFNVLLNQMLEVSRGSRRHGSCGRGVGLTLGDREHFGPAVLLAGDLARPAVVREKLALARHLRLDVAEQLCEPLERRCGEQGRNQFSEAGPEDDAGRQALRRELREYERRIRDYDLDGVAERYARFAARVAIRPEELLLERVRAGGVVFEGAQGVLLDAAYGFFPHVTRSRTTFLHADQVLDAAGCRGRAVRVGILRAYATRHGAGPFVTEDAELGRRVPPCDNGANPWQGKFRVGWFDAVASRYAIAAAGGVDCVALTCLDRLAPVPERKLCSSYQWTPTGGEAVRGQEASAEDASGEFFDFNGPLITAIRLPPAPPAGGVPGSALAALLAKVAPCYEASPAAGPRGDAAAIADALGVPVAIRSHGPAACHKECVVDLAKWP